MNLKYIIALIIGVPAVFGELGQEVKFGVFRECEMCSLIDRKLTRNTASIIGEPELGESLHSRASASFSFDISVLSRGSYSCKSR